MASHVPGASVPSRAARMGHLYLGSHIAYSGGSKGVAGRAAERQSGYVVGIYSRHWGERASSGHRQEGEHTRVVRSGSWADTCVT